MLKNPNYVYGPKGRTVPLHLNFGQFILERMSAHNDKIAQINGLTGETLTYKEIVQQSMRFAISLSELGVRKGDIVAIMSEIRRECWPAVIGSACTGATVTTLTSMGREGELQHELNISKPKYLIISPKWYEEHEKFLKTFVCIEKIIIFGDATNTALYSFNDLVFADDNSEIDIDSFSAVDVRGQEDVLFIIYSSGTTGLPKGVCLTHLNVLASQSSDLRAERDIEATLLNARPWFHVTGLIAGITCIDLGWTVVYLEEYDVGLFMKTIEKYKVQHLIVAPNNVIEISKSDIECDLSSVTIIFSVTAPLTKNTIDLAYQRFSNLKGFLQGYGLSETTLGIIRYKFSYEGVIAAKPGSVGFVEPGNVVKILDLKSGQPVGPNQQGEIYVKGPLLMKGYIGRNKSEDFDHEGFFRTGDVGYYDEDRYFYICDRLKDLIKYNGYQVPPAELEAVLIQHKAVKDAGVIGIEDELAGEVPLAFVVLQPGMRVTERELKDHVSSQLSDQKHLRGGVRFVNSILKNSNGKILRDEMRKLIKM